MQDGHAKTNKELLVGISASGCPAVRSFSHNGENIRFISIFSLHGYD